VPSPNVKRLPPQGIQSVVQLGLRANWQQFTLLVIVNAFVGGMVVSNAALCRCSATRCSALASTTAVLSFIVSFGVVKALANLFAGRLSDRIGRKGVLVAGWLVGLPVPLLIIFAPSWGWVVFANVLLGINQGLCWSTTVIMKIDLVGPARRGLAMGLNEAGWLRRGLALSHRGRLPGCHVCAAAPAILARHRFCPGGSAALALLRARVGMAMRVTRQRCWHIKALQNDRLGAVNHSCFLPGFGGLSRPFFFPKRGPGAPPFPPFFFPPPPPPKKEKKKKKNPNFFFFLLHPPGKEPDASSGFSQGGVK